MLNITKKKKEEFFFSEWDQYKLEFDGVLIYVCVWFVRFLIYFSSFIFIY